LHVHVNRQGVLKQINTLLQDYNVVSQLLVTTRRIGYLGNELESRVEEVRNQIISYTPTKFTSMLHYNSLRKILQGDVDQRLFSTKPGPSKNSSNQTATIQQYPVYSSHFPPALFRCSN